MGRENKNGTIIKFSKRNWDMDCMYDIMSQKGFLITEPAETKLDDGNQKSIYGPRSPLYGTDMTDENGYAERYRCECGSFKGTRFKGEICPFCHTEVKFEDSDIEITGWIPTGEYPIINPYFYNKLDSALGKNNLYDIVNVKKKVGRDGHSEILANVPMGQNAEHPFVGIGPRAFYERYEEILEWFSNKKKNKKELFDELLEYKSYVFTHHIPIYSTKLRPQSQTSTAFYFTEFDKCVNPLVNICIKIREGECNEMEIDKFLNAAQTRTNKLWTMNVNSIKGKKGYIRWLMLGGALNHTARNVIVPDPTLRANECDLSYHTFNELMSMTIMHYIMKYDDCTLGEAYKLWKDSTSQFSPKVYGIMKIIVQKKNPYVVIDRNPTLNFTSTVLLKIRNVKPDFTDKTLPVPLTILPGLNADFDGDVMNIISLEEKEIVKFFTNFSPIMNMISRDTGLLNTQYALTKDSLIDLNYWANNDLDDTEEIDDETRQRLEALMSPPEEEPVYFQ